MTMTRRDAIKTGLSAAALGATGNFDWVLPALAQGEVVVPFTEFPPTFNPVPAADRRRCRWPWSTRSARHCTWIR